MKFNNTYIKWGTVSILVILIIPILIDYLIIGNNFPSNINDSDWMSFFGSYIGSLIGAFVTLIGLIITLNFTRKQNNEERRLGFAPHFKYTMNQKTLLNKKHDIDIFIVVDENPNTNVNATLKLKNVGNGPGLEMIVSNIFFDAKDISSVLVGSDGIVENGSEIFMLIDLRLRLDEIDNNKLIKNLPGSLVEYSPPSKDVRKTGTLSMCIEYEDLVGNKYEQIIELIMPITLESEKGSNKWKYCKPELQMSKIEKPNIVK